MDTTQQPAEAGNNKMAVLFDLDGTLMDTESLYTDFWNKVGREFLNMGDLGPKIKGQSLAHIFNTYFVGRPDVQSMVSDKLYEFEYCMKYDYLPGAEAFLKELREAGIPTALVTSSNEAKMRHVYRVRPEFKDYFTTILTGECFRNSKPAPDCFVQAMEELGVEPENTFIFEDSTSGLQAARAAGGFVVGLTTTNPRETLEKEADVAIDDYADMTVERLLSMNGGKTA